jgi:hypothetical protein
MHPRPQREPIAQTLTLQQGRSETGSTSKAESITDGDEVAKYEKMFAQLAEIASIGPDARPAHPSLAGIAFPVIPRGPNLAA